MEMKAKKILATLTCALLIQFGNAQVVFNKIVYGQDSVNDYATCILNFHNEGFLVGGSKFDFLNNRDYSLIIRLNEWGDTIWKRQFDFNLNAADVIRGITLATDGNIVCLGKTQDTLGLKSDAMLLKVDTLGNLLWMKRYGELVGNESGYAVKTSKDSGLVFTCWTTSNAPNGYEDVFLIKTDSSGNLQWRKQYGGSDNDLIYSIDFTTDGGYILFGTTYSFGAGQSDYYLIKTDSLGNLIWQKTYGDIYLDYGLKAITTLDGGYLMIGARNLTNTDQDGAIIKTDSAGNIEWQKFYSRGLNDELVDVKQFSDSSYAFVGSVRDSSLNNTWTGWAIMANPNGDTIWTKQFLPDPVFANNTKNNYFRAMDILDNKGIIACGDGSLNSAIPAQRDYDVWVVKMDSTGCADTSCVVTTAINAYYLEPAIKISPNPNSGNFIINYTLPQNKSGTLEIFDVLGKRVYAQALPPWSVMQRIDAVALPQGMYVCVVRSEGVSKGVKWVKE